MTYWIETYQGNVLIAREPYSPVALPKARMLAKDRSVAHFQGSGYAGGGAEIVRIVDDNGHVIPCSYSFEWERGPDLQTA
jgi:hypothetical protein